jgi:hypothetical protein
MKRTSIRVALAAAFIACIPTAWAANDGCRPVNGHFEAVIVPPGEGHCPLIRDLLCTAGRVWGGIQGDYQFVMSGAEPAAALRGIPTALFYTGVSTVSLHDGSTAVGIDSGVIDPPPGQLGFASLISFGKGGSQGQIRLMGQLDAAAGTTAGEYVGQFCEG